MSEKTLVKYKLIIDEWFINGFKGSDSYLKFFPNAKRKSANVNFSKIKDSPEMQAYIREKHEEAARIVNITKEGILNELKAWLECDITETINLSSEEIKLLPVQIRRLINKYKQSKKSFYDKDGNLLSIEENIELSFVSKERAIEMINKHIGFYEVDNKQKAINVDLSLYSYEQLERLAGYDKEGS